MRDEIVKKITVKLKKSTISCNKNQIATIKGLGLRKVGHVRELENTLERALLICNNKYLTEEDLGSVLDEKETIIEAQKEPATIETGLEEEPEKSPYVSSDAVIKTVTDSNPVLKIATLKEIEMDAIKSSVERNKWNMTTTAEELGISRMTLYRKLEQYGLRGKE